MKPILREIANFERFSISGLSLQSLIDPDEILRSNNYDYNILRDLLNDPHLTAAIQQRKMQVMQMGWEVENTDNTNLRDEIKDLLREMPLQQIMNEILDAIFYGFVVHEINWKLKDKKYIPNEVKSKPQEWFIFGKEGELRLRKNVNGGYVFEEGDKLPPYKFILTQHQPSFTNPYGQKILSKCYWAVKLKHEAMDFWHLLAERFGIPYLVGRSLPGSSPTEKAQLLDELQAMAEDLITVIDSDKTIDIIQNQKYEVGDIYDKLIGYYNSEISKAVLTVTLTMDVGKVGSYKAADIHKEMLGFIGITDKKLVERAINKILSFYCKLNYGMDESPTVKLTKKEAVVEESAARDKILTGMGVNFTKEYFMKRYNLSEKDFELTDDRGQFTVGSWQ